MNYAILKSINGNFFIHAEGIKTIAQAKTIYHGLCQTLWNAADVKQAEVAIIDEQLNIVDGYREFIHHETAGE